jgi:hypothetical protein
MTYQLGIDVGSTTIVAAVHRADGAGEVEVVPLGGGGATVPSALHLARDGGQVIGEASGGWLLGELVEHFAQLPAELRRLEVEGAGELAGPLTEAAARRRVELVLRPLPRRTGYIAGLDK